MLTTVASPTHVTCSSHGSLPRHRTQAGYRVIPAGMGTDSQELLDNLVPGVAGFLAVADDRPHTLSEGQTKRTPSSRLCSHPFSYAVLHDRVFPGGIK